jgi:hypothetical protein
MPLYSLLEKDVKFSFGSAQSKAFKDSSDFACGGVILQRNPWTNVFLPVAYFSRKLTTAEQGYPIREKELLSLVYIFQKYRHYLLTGTGSVARTDHQSLATLLTGSTPTSI